MAPLFRFPFFGTVVFFIGFTLVVPLTERLNCVASPLTCAAFYIGGCVSLRTLGRIFLKRLIWCEIVKWNVVSFILICWKLCVEHFCECFPQNIKSHIRHPLRQNRDTAATHQFRNRHSAATVIPSARPNRSLRFRIKLACNQSWHETTVSCDHFLAVYHRKPSTDHDDDLGIYTGERFGHFVVVGDLMKVLWLLQIATHLVENF